MGELVATAGEVEVCKAEFESVAVSHLLLPFFKSNANADANANV
jgi:hypothetical protein